MEPNYIYMEEEDEVLDLSNMMVSIFRHWRLGVIVVICMAALFGGFLSYRQIRGRENRFSDEKLEGLQENMTQSQRDVVTQLFTRYDAYKKKLNDNQYYLDHSYLMQLDPKEVSILKVEYRVTSNQSDIVSSFSKQTFGMEHYVKMAQAVGNGVDQRYFYEIVTLYPGSSGADALNAASSKEISSRVAPDEYRGNMVLTIYGRSKEECQAISEIAKKAVETHCKKLIESGTQVTVEQIGENYQQTIANDISNQQLAKIREGGNLATEFSNFEKNSIETLEDDESALLNYLIEEEDHLEQEHISWKKYTVIGGAIGFILTFMILAIRYLFNRDVKTMDEFKFRFKGNVLGVIRNVSDKKGPFAAIDRWLENLAYDKYCGAPRERMLPTLALRLSALCSHSDLKNVFILKNMTEEANEETIHMLEKETAIYDLKVQSGTPTRNVENLKQFLDADAVVIAQQLDGTSKTELENMIALCEENRKKILGGVILCGKA